MSEIVQVSDADVRRVMDAPGFLESCDAAFRLYGSGEMRNPAREETLQRDGDEDLFRLELPGTWGDRFRGRKVIEERSDYATGRLGARTAVVEIEDEDRGLKAILDAETLTNGRTGAAGVLGARYLGPEKVRRAAVIGTGRIAAWTVACLDAEWGPVEIRVTSRSSARREDFVARHRDGVGGDLRDAENVEEAVTGADVVITAVPASEPILRGEWLKANAHVSVIGGDPRTAQLAPDLFASRQVVVDHPEQARASGDFLRAAEDTVRRARYGSRTATIGDAALGRLAALKGTGTIAYFTGLAVQDLHAGVTALRRLGVLGD